MKFLVAFVAVVAVALAGPINKPQSNDLAQVQAIVAAINSPSTDPATAVLLQEQLGQILASMLPISVGPAIVDVPVITAPVVEPVVESVTADSAPLVQIIVKVNGQQQDSIVIPESAVVAPAPVDPVSVETPVAPGPVNVVDNVVAPVSPVSVGTPVVVSPVSVGSPVAVSPVSVGAPIAVSPVAVGTPVLPSPVVALPEILN